MATVAQPPPFRTTSTIRRQRYSGPTPSGVSNSNSSSSTKNLQSVPLDACRRLNGAGGIHSGAAQPPAHMAEGGDGEGSGGGGSWDGGGKGEGGSGPQTKGGQTGKAKREDAEGRGENAN